MTEAVQAAWETVDTAIDLPLNVYNLTHRISGFFNYQWSAGELVHPLTVQFSGYDINILN